MHVVPVIVFARSGRRRSIIELKTRLPIVYFSDGHDQSYSAVESLGQRVEVVLAVGLHEDIFEIIRLVPTIIHRGSDLLKLFRVLVHDEFCMNGERALCVYYFGVGAIVLRCKRPRIIAQPGPAHLDSAS